MRRQLRVCAHHGCGELARATYCPDHDHDPRRTARWRRVRGVLLRDSPICDHCRAEFATEVNHVVRIVDGGAPFDYENLEALCSSCHHKVTADQQRR